MGRLLLTQQGPVVAPVARQWGEARGGPPPAAPEPLAASEPAAAMVMTVQETPQTVAVAMLQAVAVATPCLHAMEASIYSALMVAASIFCGIPNICEDLSHAKMYVGCTFPLSDLSHLEVERRGHLQEGMQQDLVHRDTVPVDKPELPHAHSH